MPSLRNWRKKRVTESNDKKVPALRFKGFTDDWEQRKLGEIVQRINRKNVNLTSTLPLTISAQYGLIDQRNFFDKQIASEKLEKYILLKKGEFAYNKSYSRNYPFGAIKRLNNYKFGALSTLYIAFKPVTIDTEYLEQYFDSTKWYKEIYKRATEGARNHGLLNISSQDFFYSLLTIPLGTLEQKKIAKLLKTISSLLDLQQRKLSLIKTLKRSFLSDLFFKTSTNSIVITLKQVTSIRGGYAFKSKEFTENGYPIIKIANISNNGEIKGPYSYTNNFNKKYILTKNDIVLAMSGATTGKIAKLRSSKSFLQNQRIGYFCKTNNIDYNYLYYLLISDQFKKQLKRITIAGAQPNVSSLDIENFRFSVLSSKNKQKKISDFLNKLDIKIRITNKKITIFSQLKRSLLNNMFI